MKTQLRHEGETLSVRTQPERPQASALSGLIARQVLGQGATRHDWSGLLFYRYDRTFKPTWDEVGSLSLCIVAQGRKHVRIGACEYFYDPCSYLVLTRGLHFHAEVVEASRAHPFLSLILQLPPDLISEVYDQLNDVKVDPRALPNEPVPDAFVNALDPSLIGAVGRFLLALETPNERQVLAPLHLREIVYHLLQTEQRARLLEHAAREAQAHAVTSAISVMKQEMQQPLTVQELARAVCMSESAFAHLFKATTGVPPLQYLKQLRMEHASKLITHGTSVGDAADKVGYSSASHFTTEFKRYFGDTPKTYSQRLGREYAANGNGHHGEE